MGILATKCNQIIDSIIGSDHFAMVVDFRGVAQRVKFIERIDETTITGAISVITPDGSVDTVLRRLDTRTLAEVAA